MHILIYGLGSIAQKHIAAAKQCWPDALQLSAMRHSRPAPSVPDVQNIYDESELDGVPDFAIIATPTARHEATIERVLKLNIPLLIEKPVVDTVAAAARMQAAINVAQVTTYTACNLRFHPCIQYLRDVLAKRDVRIDEVTVYCGSYLPDWRPGQDFRTVYSAQAELGGGVHLDLIHELDYCIWLLGLPVRTHHFFSHRSHLDISAIDYAHYHLEYPEFSATVTLNYFRRDRKRTLELVTSEGTWLADLALNRVFFQGTLKADFPAFTIQNTYVSQLRYFHDHIRQHQPPMNSFAEAAQTLAVALGA